MYNGGCQGLGEHGPGRYGLMGTDFQFCELKTVLWRQPECTSCHGTVHFEASKLVYSALCIFHHSFQKKNKRSKTKSRIRGSKPREKTRGVAGTLGRIYSLARLAAGEGSNPPCLPGGSQCSHRVQINELGVLRR